MNVSIIIPTFNRAKFLQQTLISILQYSDKKEMEVIIIDNGSADNTRQICSDFESNNPYVDLKYIYDPEPGLLTGRHRGAAEAKGEILSFIDDDVELSSQWLSTILEVMQSRPEIQFITGPNLPKYEIDPPEWLKYFWTSTSYGGKMCPWLSLLDLGDQEKLIDANYVWGLNFTVRRSTFTELGGFHPDVIPKHLQHFQGDGETGLTIKANERGLKALYHPGVMLYHQVPGSRLTYDYFDQRAYYQGICDSFTAFRKAYGFNKKEVSHYKVKSCIRHYIKIFLMPIITRVPISQDLKWIPNDIQKLRRRFYAKGKEGYEFHQKAFRENEAVRKWVLKENYFDYKLPDND